MKVKEVGEDDFAPWITGPLGNYAYAHVLFPCKMEDVECIQHTSGIIVENDNVDNVHLHTNDKIMYYKKRYKEIASASVLVTELKDEEETNKDNKLFKISLEERKDLVDVAFRRGYFWYVGKIPFNCIYPL